MRRSAGAAAAAFALVLGSCGGPAETSDPDGAGGSVAVAVPEGFPTLEPANVGQSLLEAMVGAGEVSFSSEIFVSTPVTDGSLRPRQKVGRTGVLRWHEAGVDVDMTVELAGEQLLAGGVIVLDGVYYLTGPWLALFDVPFEEIETTWLRLAPDDPEVPADQLAIYQDFVADVHPEHSLALLDATSQLQPVRVEQRTVDQVVRYEGTIELERASGLVDEEVWYQVEGLPELPREGTLTYELLVNQDGLPRLFGFVFTGPDVEIETRVTYDQWGTARDITEPDGYLTPADLPRS